MFKVAVLGIALVGFNTEPMKNGADFSKFFRKYKQVLMGVQSRHETMLPA